MLFIRLMEGVSQRVQSRRGWAAALATILLLALALWVVERQLIMPSVHRAQTIETIDRSLGATVETLDTAEAGDLAAGHDPDDLIITSVAAGGPADRAGIRPGDVIDTVNGMGPGSGSTLAAAFGNFPIRMIINRQGEHVIVTLPAGSPAGAAGPGGRA